MTNDSAYQLDKALLISDEGKMVNSLTFRSLHCMEAGPATSGPLACLILFVVIRGGGGYQCPDLARWAHDDKNPDYNSDRNIL